MIHLDTDPWELGKNYPAEVAILGDPKGTLPELTDAIRAACRAAHKAPRKDRLKSASEATKTELEKLRAKARSLAGETPVQPLALINAISEILPKDAVVIDETISSGGGLRQLVKSDDPQSFFGLRGGGIGWGLPASIGVKIALPDRPVIALVGDGSAMYTCQSLWTAARYKSRRRVRHLQQHVVPHPEAARCSRSAATRRRLDNYVGMELNEPAIDFVGLARSLGVPASAPRPCTTRPTSSPRVWREEVRCWSRSRSPANSNDGTWTPNIFFVAQQFRMFDPGTVPGV